MNFALIGDKISYSMSPLIHEMISDVALKYSIIEISVEELSAGKPEILKKLDGFNVTIPHKQEIIKYCNQLDPAAELIGAVNTVQMINGRWKGYNTDFLGFIASLKESVKNYFDYHPVLIGYGGVARAVIFALQEMGFKNVSVVGGMDDKERRNFINDMNASTKIRLLDTVPELPLLWINGTPIGGAKIPDIPEGFLDIHYGDVLFDLNYTPYPTHLEQYAHKKGVKTVNGLKMLVYQAFEAQKIWFGEKIQEIDINGVIHTLTHLGTAS